MFVLVVYRDSKNFPLVGPFKTADAAIKHLRTLPNAHLEDWRLAPVNKPVQPKKVRKAVKRKRARK